MFCVRCVGSPTSPCCLSGAATWAASPCASPTVGRCWLRPALTETPSLSSVSHRPCSYRVTLTSQDTNTSQSVSTNGSGDLSSTVKHDTIHTICCTDITKCYIHQHSNNKYQMMTLLTTRCVLSTVYEIPSGTVLAVFSGHLSVVYDLCWSRDDRSLLSASSDGTVR